jgi:hypothetical protein
MVFIFKLLLILAMALFANTAPTTSSAVPVGFSKPVPIINFLLKMHTNTLLQVFAPQVAVLYKRNPQSSDSYQWTCNSLSLSLTSIEVCANNLGLLRKTDQCVADPNNGTTGHLCENSGVKITGVSWDGKKETVQCGWVADAVNFLTGKCGDQGGKSAEIVFNCCKFYCFRYFGFPIWLTERFSNQSFRFCGR